MSNGPGPGSAGNVIANVKGMSDLEICFLPAQWLVLEKEKRAGAVCVVIDVIRATSTIVAALARGAREIRPVAGLAEALALKESNPKALLAGERGGCPPPGFDLGNSPREMTAEKVKGREMILTTTNGTRALAATAGARAVVTASLLNLEAAAAKLRELGPPWLVLCAGHEGGFGVDDAIVAGAMAQILGRDHAFVSLYQSVRGDLAESLLGSLAGQELVKVGMGDDVPFCAELNQFALVPMLGDDGVLRV
ncbi:MAG TPA: 2-phosphosulfolactate phosphatase [Candidatus Methylacidiphilales bacterium]|nr:2-phosphosulfolactate phosphatase [Candidatus Methylacidiphilales bacterium]